MQIIKISPKGQITIPKKYRNLIKNQHLSLSTKDGMIILQPIVLKNMEEIEDSQDLKNFSHLAEPSFEFWNDEGEDTYEKFYKE